MTRLLRKTDTIAREIESMLYKNGTGDWDMESHKSNEVHLELYKCYPRQRCEISTWALR